MAKVQILKPKNGKPFDMEALMKKRQQSKGAVRKDLVAELRAIAPEIEHMEVGDTAKCRPEGEQTLRQLTMQIAAKISHLTARGGAWAGRTFITLSDGEGIVYVQRGEDIEPKKAPIRKTGGGALHKKNRKGEETVSEEQEELTPSEAAEVVSKGGMVKEEGGAIVTVHE